jgi:hypothetical protein
MSAEFALQLNMFTGDLVDSRSAKQKKQARVRNQPQQVEMFSQREMAQFGVNAHPTLPLSPTTTLKLEMVDPRTDEEKERDLRQQIEQQTYPLPIWEEEPLQTSNHLPDADFEAQPLSQVEEEGE